jgi:hexokinase
VCSVQLHGDKTYSLTQSKVVIPRSVRLGATSKDFFGFVALQIEKFLQKNDLYNLNDGTPTDSEEEQYPLGLTFSFAFEQHGVNRGTLLKWDKDFNIPDAVGKEIGSLLQTELDNLRLPVVISTLTNDTVGTLMARSYTSPGKGDTLLGAVFGTGTNGAYMERISQITKLPGSDQQSASYMAINTEWGGFDNDLSVLRPTRFDKQVDETSANPGLERFEKLISGLYLSEILRLAILELIQQIQKCDHMQFDILASSSLYRPWSVESRLLSILAADDSKDLLASRKALEETLDWKNPTTNDAKSVQLIAKAIGTRSARLAGVAIAGVILQSGRLQHIIHMEKSHALQAWSPNSFSKAAISCMKSVMVFIRRIWSGICSFGRSDEPATNATSKSSIEPPLHASRREDYGTIDVGLNGSLVEHYPGYEEIMRTTLRNVEQIGPQREALIRFGLAKDGSSVGAALVAQAALERRES